MPAGWLRPANGGAVPATFRVAYFAGCRHNGQFLKAISPVNSGEVNLNMEGEAEVREGHRDMLNE